LSHRDQPIADGLPAIITSPKKQYTGADDDKLLRDPAVRIGVSIGI